MAYLLDTDMLTLLMKGHAQVVQSVAKHPPADIFISVITVEEQLSGWYTVIRRARQPHEMETAYRRLLEATKFMSRVGILPFSLDAIHRWGQLKLQKLNIGSMDLKIGSIALEERCVMVSRNVRDFQRISGVVMEDWTV